MATLTTAISGPTNVLTLDDVGRLALNMAVSGPNLPAGARITGINTSLNTITLNVNTLGAVEALQEFSFEEVQTGGGQPIGATVRIGSNAMAPIILGTDSTSAGAANGKLTVTNLADKTLILHGQTMGNQIRGMIDEGLSKLGLVVNPNVGNNDLYGAGSWILSNVNNNFSGNITVNLGSLVLAGNLGSGSAPTGILGDLTATRTIDLGTSNFDGRGRYNISNGQTDNLGAGGGLTSTGSLVFNDPTAGVFTLGNNITFTQSFNNTTNPGNGRLINNGLKTIVINGSFTSGATGNRSWILDGTNVGDNILNGSISNGSGGAVVGIQKDGAGKWILNNSSNTMTGTVTINRGVLEFAGGRRLGTPRRSI